jgi:hypothetical protein
MNDSSDEAQNGQLADLLTAAGNTVERMLAADSTFPSLLEATKVSQQCLHTASGLNDMDYVSLDAVLPAAKVKQVCLQNWKLKMMGILKCLHCRFRA